jgi:hypothetical protein
MTTTGTPRSEFHPGRDILGKTTTRNRSGRYHTVSPRGL